MSAEHKWTEATLTRALALNTFAGHVCALPNTTWNGGEVDLLVVSKCLRLIDCEMKISRADLRSDVRKEKWWQSETWEQTRQRQRALKDGREYSPRLRVEWPSNTWKHYYAMPADIWTDALLDDIPKSSGVLLATARHFGEAGWVYYIECRRRSKPCRDAAPLTALHLQQISRLVSYRLWCK